MASAHAKLLDKYPETNSATYKDNTMTRAERRHVVVSTKYVEPWFGWSVRAKMTLIEQGLTVYNPNTDNAEAWKEKANDRWLRTFTENLDLVEKTEGFVLQVQQGLEGQKSDMQVAEENMGTKWNIPVVSVWASSAVSAAQFVGMVKRAAELFKQVDVWGRWVPKDLGVLHCCGDDAFSFYTGGYTKTGKRHGHGVDLFASGEVVEGEWREGKRHGRGPWKFPDGSVYDGEWREGKQHGRGVFKYPSGATYDGDWLEDKKHGRGIYKYLDGSVYDGEWREDTMHGRGVARFADGFLQKGVWRDGAFQG